MDKSQRTSECGADTYEKWKHQPSETSDGTTKANLDKKLRGPNFYLPSELWVSQAHGGKQVWRPLIPRVEGLGHRKRALVQKYTDLIDLNDIGFNPKQLAPSGILQGPTVSCGTAQEKASKRHDKNRP